MQVKVLFGVNVPSTPTCLGIVIHTTAEGFARLRP